MKLILILTRIAFKLFSCKKRKSEISHTDVVKILLTSCADNNFADHNE